MGELVKVPLEVSTTMLPPKLMLTPRTSPHSVDSHITVSLTRISFSLKVVSVDQERDKSLLERLFSHKLLPSLLSNSKLNSSIPLPRLVTVNSRLSKRRISSSDHSLPRLPKNEKDVSKQPHESIKL